MANSKLATWHWKGYTDHYNTRTHKIDKITIHHQAGNLTPEQTAQATQSRGGSWNYCITSEGKIGVMIDEHLRAWTSSNRENDMRAVTIEVANDEIGGNWHVSDKALKACINLCVDICKRNGIKKLSFTGNAKGNLTMHKMFAATACPGSYLESKFPYIASEVNKQLNAKTTTATKHTTTTKKKSVSEIAKEVIAGKWGNGEERKKKLTAAGYNYNTVQTEVNKLVSSTKKKSVNELAKEVIAGKWGNNPAREKKLKAAGYNYEAVQAEVNRILQKR